MPFFSVVLPTYNRAHLIEKAIRSVIAQTFSDWELIVVDDGSTDHTKEVVERLQDKDERIRYLWQENAERSAARNHGIQKAQGEYISFLDSDDYYLPHHLTTFHEKIEAEGKPKALFFGNTLEDREGNIIKIPPPSFEEKDPISFLLLNPLSSSRICGHRYLFLEFLFNKFLKISEDTELWVRIVRKYNVLYYVDVYTHVTVNHDGRTVGRMNIESYRANLDVKKMMVKQYRGHLRLDIRRRILYQAYFVLAQSHSSRRELVPMIFALLNAFIYRPFFRAKEMVYMIWEQLSSVKKP